MQVRRTAGVLKRRSFTCGLRAHTGVEEVPRYEYKCKKCEKSFDVIHGVDDKVKDCKFCGSEVRRVFHPIGIVFKGSGFYATDSRKGDSKSHQPSREERETTESAPADKKEEKKEDNKDKKDKKDKKESAVKTAS